jgi:Na+-transporting methylmalonyl-CoA/oxaloacetate decarboxylase gamma subunit
MCGMAMFLLVLFIFQTCMVLVMQRLLSRSHKRQAEWKAMVDQSIANFKDMESAFQNVMDANKSLAETNTRLENMVKRSLSV